MISLTTYCYTINAPIHGVSQKKDPLLFFFIIHSNDDQFTENFYQL